MIGNTVTLSYHVLPSRQSAVLHWFHNQRLMDPEAGREVGGVRERICSEHMTLYKHKTDKYPGFSPITL